MIKKIDWNVKFGRRIGLEKLKMDDEFGFEWLNWADSGHPNCSN